MNQTRLALRLNVGFLINQSVGFSRDFYFDLPHVHLEPDLDLQELSGASHITRTAQGLLVQVKMHASMHTECVRCLSPMEQPLDVDFSELFSFSFKTAGDTGLMLPEDGHIDLAPLLREYMLLEVPINPLCHPECRGLCPICGEILGEEDHHHEEDMIDPRLARLKALLD